MICSGVRGGGTGGGAAPRLEKLMANFVFRASAKFFKNPERQKIFQRSEKF